MALMLAQGIAGVSTYDRFGQRYGCFADDLDVMDDSIHGLPIVRKSLEVDTFDIRRDAIDRLLNILEPQPPVSRRHELPL